MTDTTPISLQQRFWNDWNTAYRENHINAVSRREAEVVREWLEGLALAHPQIIEIGCGTGWLCVQLVHFGTVTGVDLADEVIARARSRVPQATFLSGDIQTLAIASAAFDVLVTLEVIAHVPDARTFIDMAARVLKPGGYLMLATQNPFVVKRNEVAPAAPGQLRRWLTRKELVGLLSPQFKIESLRTVAPQGNRGVLRVINSSKLTGAAEWILGQHRVTRIKERFGFGFSIMILARRM